MQDGEAGSSSKVKERQRTVHENALFLLLDYLANVLTAALASAPPTAQWAESVLVRFCTLEASPGSRGGPELECVERHAADKPAFSHRDWK